MAFDYNTCPTCMTDLSQFGDPSERDECPLCHGTEAYASLIMRGRIESFSNGFKLMCNALLRTLGDSEKTE